MTFLTTVHSLINRLRQSATQWDAPERCKIEAEAADALEALLKEIEAYERIQRRLGEGADGPD